MHDFAIRFRLIPSSKTRLPSSIFDKPLDNQPIKDRDSNNPSIVESKDPRFGPITIDWVDMESNEKGKDKEKSSTGHGKEPATASFTAINESSGNATLAEGIIHLYRTSPNSGNVEQYVEDGTMLAILAIPSWMNVSDFLTFVSPAYEGFVHLRIVRDALPNRALALIKFRSAQDASDFREEFNGKYFNSMEPETCHVVKINSVMIETPDLVTGSFPPPPDGSVELPTCPVCLERMDTAITGLVTVPCSHTFHCQCLSKWENSRCPVCRYSQKALFSGPQLPSSRGRSQSSANVGSMTTCRDCSTTTNLWICLICGNVGCGRYGRAHAHAHYQLTTHLYALELETQRVWDYAGDAYVHRLIQNRADGKLVELPSASITTGSVTDNSRALGPGPSDAMAAEKIEAIGIEYSYLLTSQLDSQRAFYEEQLETMKEQLSSAFTKLDLQSKEMETITAQWQLKEQKWREEVESRQEEAAKERVKLEKKVEKTMELARKFEKELREERMVNDGLLQNLSAVKKRSEAFEEEKAQFMGRIGELEDQMRDIMFYLETRDKVDKEGGELAGASVEVKTPPSSSSSSRKKKK
ncbi:zf-UBP-domain-containing protein, partial [Serendipita vermifera]